jgi:hypothetical protein
VDKLTSVLGKPRFVVNEKESVPGFTPVQWSKVSSLRRAVLLVEDVVSLSSSAFAVLQHLLVYQARHQEVDVYMVSKLSNLLF